jgi:chaperonin GroEL
MGLFQVNKPKSAAKIMIPSSKKLGVTVLDTLEHIAQMVGATLGPGGKQILIERPEMNMKPIVTKDGVTVIKNLGYKDSVQQLILESVRDAAGRTASEAGDGTTTATILSYAVASHLNYAIQDTSRMSPQRIVREMQALVPFIEQRIVKYKMDVTGEHYQDTLHRVATLSANGDRALAAAVIEAYDTVGEEGNMTIVEIEGKSKYEVERIDGYSVDIGYEDSCKNLAPLFLNDKTGSLVVVQNPMFILFDGVITDISQVFEALNRLSEYVGQNRHDKTVILVAHGFSDPVIGDLQVNWSHPQTILKVFPLRTPENAIKNSQSDFLYDLQAYTGAPVYNPVTRPLIDLNAEEVATSSRATFFECGRFRSSIMVNEDEFAIQVRVDELKRRLENPESEYEQRDLEVRLGKLTSGIARLKICGPSAGETREKRDRADDAWCAIRGAIKHGVLPGGGFTLVKLSADLAAHSSRARTAAGKAAAGILSDALLEPVKTLYRNYGYTDKQIDHALMDLLSSSDQTFDIMEQRWVNISELLDSVPACLEAIRNSISIASLLGTLGGIISFQRDQDTDFQEQQFARRFERAIGENMVDVGSDSV